MAEGLISQQQIDRVKEIAKEKGVDVEHLTPAEQFERDNIEQFNRALRIKKGRKYFSMSVWPGNIPLKFDFSKWKPDLQPNVEKAKQLGNQAYKAAKSIVSHPNNYVLAGIRGTGKTSLALAIMYQAKQEGLGVMFVSTDELSSLIGKQYDLTDVKNRLSDIERAMKETDVLILDDFGTEGGMKGAIKPVRTDMQEFMYRVANARVDFENNKAKRSTIITTNNSRQQLESMYNEKLISRLMTSNPERQLAFDLKDVRGI
ncbi:ATP-binding protein [Liquorilactobacillus mali]|uniref:DNA replication protein n=1 Tax=Liquorilactobacillus mali TaxID=1618 RepID=A0A0R2FS28_9LACO|nr:ATP-binding protein [Liquorilactobacillus mali]KRN31120.1 DNA replication protein [Liquorilactobacillus mali]